MPALLFPVLFPLFDHLCFSSSLEVPQKSNREIAEPPLREKKSQGFDGDAIEGLPAGNQNSVFHRFKDKCMTRRDAVLCAGPDHFLLRDDFLYDRLEIDRKMKRVHAEPDLAAFCQDFCLARGDFLDYRVPVIPAGDIGEGVPDFRQAGMDDDRFFDDHLSAACPGPGAFFGNGDSDRILKKGFFHMDIFVNAASPADHIALQSLDQGMRYP